MKMYGHVRFESYKFIILFKKYVSSIQISVIEKVPRVT